MLIELLKILADRISKETPYKGRLEFCGEWPHVAIKRATSNNVHFVIVPNRGHEGYFRLYSWDRMSELNKWKWRDIQDPTFNPNAVFDKIIKYLAHK